MLSFAVFEHRVPMSALGQSSGGVGVGGVGVGGSENLPADWPLRHAYMFGADDVPVQAEIRYDPDSGCICCEKGTPDSAGICLQFAVDALDAAHGGGGVGAGHAGRRTPANARR